MKNAVLPSIRTATATPPPLPFSATAGRKLDFQGEGFKGRVTRETETDPRSPPTLKPAFPSGGSNLLIVGSTLPGGLPDGVCLLHVSERLEMPGYFANM